MLSAVVNTRTLKNFIALVILQGGNYILPLVTFPFLARALGLDAFGSWMFALAIVSICRTFVAYGFDLTATNEVALHRGEPEYISELFACILLTRFAILVSTYLLVGALSIWLEPINAVLTLTLVALLVLAGEALFPVWLFQGMEQMGLITKVRLGYRALFAIGVICFVRDPTDILLIPIIEAVGSICAGLFASSVAFRRYDLKLIAPRWTTSWYQLRKSTAVFTTTIAVHFYTTMNTLLLGFLATPHAVAQYAIGEKIYSAVRGLFGPIVQALYPTMARLNREDPSALAASVRILCVGVFSALACAAAAVFVLAAPLIRLVAGQADVGAERTLQVLALALCFAMGSLLSPLLVIRNKTSHLVIITSCTALIGIAAALPLVKPYGALGAAFAFLLSQLFNSAALLVANRAVLLRRPSAIFAATAGRET